MYSSDAKTHFYHLFLQSWVSLDPSEKNSSFFKYKSFLHNYGSLFLNKCTTSLLNKIIYLFQKKESHETNYILK